MSAVDINQVVTSTPTAWRIMGRVPTGFGPTGANLPVTVGGVTIPIEHVVLFRTVNNVLEHRVITDAQFEAEFPNQP